MDRAPRFLVFLFALSLDFGCTPKQAKETRSEADTSSPIKGIAAEGQVLFATCAACHGESAQGSEQMHAPGLVTLEDWYLYQQLMNFRKGVRGYHPQDTLGQQMAAMTAALKDSVAVSNVVAYVKGLKETPAHSENPSGGDIKKGERTYQSICGSCHGPSAKGNRALHAPRLNGLEDWYLRDQIRKFRNGQRGGHPGDPYGAQMVSIVEILKDDQSINDVIAYIVSVTQPGQP